ncbi:uncharacterized protein LOC133181567 [Saccostrea echinata]|uniref:uncharacterized protein LOC133181567 n=1 Tax=Saccostrea echinata TaxID=191078 RepID=UPI002A7F31F3|nr:uncharacterized protein LOC133181567 [Saccostrea echinata]
MARLGIIIYIALTLICFVNCLTLQKKHIKSEKRNVLKELVDDLRKEEKRSEHAHGIIFFFGDLNRDGRLTEVELRRLFSGNVFASHLDDLITVLMSRDLDNSQSLDVNEWEDIESMSRSELAMMLLAAHEINN